MDNNTQNQEPQSQNQTVPNDQAQKKDIAKDIPENNKAGMPPQPIFGEQGKEYLRESANIEDMPDAQENNDYDKESKDKNAIDEDHSGDSSN